LKEQVWRDLPCAQEIYVKLVDLLTLTIFFCSTNVVVDV
jgi:hypothetical protein